MEHKKRTRSNSVGITQLVSGASLLMGPSSGAVLAGEMNYISKNKRRLKGKKFCATKYSEDIFNVELKKNLQRNF